MRDIRAAGDPWYREQLYWSIRDIHSLLDEIHGKWANRLDVTTPQLIMIFALRDFDKLGKGLPVKELAKILRVDPTFVTPQTKILESRGLVSRNASAEDARVVRLALTSKALKLLGDLSARQERVNDYIFSQLSEQGVQSFIARLLVLKDRVEKANAIASVDFD